MKSISSEYCQLVKEDMIQNTSYVERQYAISVERLDNEWFATELKRIDDGLTIDSNSNSNVADMPEDGVTLDSTVIPESTETPALTVIPTATPTPIAIGGTYGTVKWTYLDEVVTFSGSGEITGEMLGEISWGCNIRKVVIENGITKIGDSALANMYYLEEIEIGNTVRERGTHAFGGCESLLTIELPISVEKIHEAAFGECTNLKEIIIRNPVVIIEDDIVDILEYVENVTIYGYEDSSAEEYAKRNGGRDFKILEDDVTWPTSSLEFQFVYDMDNYDIVAYAMGINDKKPENFFSDIGEDNASVTEYRDSVKYSRGMSYLDISDDGMYFECKLTEDYLSEDAIGKISVSGVKLGMTYEEVEDILKNMVLEITDLNYSIYSPDKSVRYDIEFDWETERVCSITVKYDESKSVRNFYK